MRSTALLLALLLVPACYPSPRRTVSDSTSVSGLALDPTAPARIVALHGGRIERSSDGGASWTVSAAPTGLDAIAASGSTIYGVAAYDSSTQTARVFRSTDGGATFAATSPLTASSSAAVVAVAPLDSSRALVALAHSPLLVETTTDGGATWTVATLGSTTTSTTTPRGAAFDATDALAAYVAHANGVLQSLDGGSSFAPLVGPFARGSVNGVAAASSSIYVATSSGLVVSRDRGATWMTTAIGRRSVVTAAALDAQDASRVFIALANEGIYGSTDGGASFTLLTSSYEGPIVASGGTILVGGARSVDGGLTWTPYGVFDYISITTIE